MMDADALRQEHLPEQIRGIDRPSIVPTHSRFNLEAIQKETIQRAYIHFQGNISRMSKALGIGRNTLYAKLKKVGEPTGAIKIKVPGSGTSDKG
jgi:transcriptional regulator of acetoin/glycerol metabolism